MNNAYNCKSRVTDNLYVDYLMNGIPKTASSSTSSVDSAFSDDYDLRLDDELNAALKPWRLNKKEPKEQQQLIGTAKESRGLYAQTNQQSNGGGAPVINGREEKKIDPTLTANDTFVLESSGSVVSIDSSDEDDPVEEMCVENELVVDEQRGTNLPYENYVDAVNDSVITKFEKVVRELKELEYNPALIASGSDVPQSGAAIQVFDGANPVEEMCVENELVVDEQRGTNLPYENYVDVVNDSVITKFEKVVRELKELEDNPASIATGSDVLESSAAIQSFENPVADPVLDQYQLSSNSADSDALELSMHDDGNDSADLAGSVSAMLHSTARLSRMPIFFSCDAFDDDADENGDNGNENGHDGDANGDDGDEYGHDGDENGDDGDENEDDSNWTDCDSDMTHVKSTDCEPDVTNTN